jgi:type III restriction enzyme
MLSERADSVVQAFENTVEIIPVQILGGETWLAGPHRPNSSQMTAFRNAAHEQYSTRSFNSDELEFAKSIDDLNVGTWMRNPSRGDGYGIQLPMKVGDSSVFYPDFLWWIGDTCFALDPTGRHILNEKVRGKLLTIDQPRIILLCRGRVMNDWTSVAEADGWTVVRPRVNRSPAPEFFSSLNDALKRIASTA